MTNITVGPQALRPSGPQDLRPSGTKDLRALDTTVIRMPSVCVAEGLSSYYNTSPFGTSSKGVLMLVVYDHKKLTITQQGITRKIQLTSLAELIGVKPYYLNWYLTGKDGFCLLGSTLANRVHALEPRKI